MILPGSYSNGFAPRDGRPLSPELWRGCVGAWAPCLGPTGLTLRDWSGQGNIATIRNGTASSAWVTSSGRYAYQSTGTNAASGTNSQQELFITKDLSTTRMSVSVWIRPTTGALQRVIAASGPNFSVPQLAIQTTTANKIQVYRGASINSTGTFTVGVWNHICVTNDGATTKIYINGSLDSSQSQTIGQSLQTEFRLGNGYWGAFEGQLNDFLFYDRILSDSHVRVLASRIGIAYEMAPRRRASSGIAFNRRRRLLVGAGS